MLDRCKRANMEVQCCLLKMSKHVLQNLIIYDHNNRSVDKITLPLQKYLRPLFPTLSASVTNQKVLERVDDLNIETNN